MSWSNSTNLRTMGSVGRYTYTESSSYPLVAPSDCIGMMISNNDTTTSLVVRIRDKSGNEIDYRVYGNLNIQTPTFRYLDVPTPSSLFDIILAVPKLEAEEGEV